jgi:hypothetical protein
MNRVQCCDLATHGHHAALRTWKSYTRMRGTTPATANSAWRRSNSIADRICAEDVGGPPARVPGLGTSTRTYTGG